MTGALYDTIGIGYAKRRQPDPRIAARITAALGTCRSVVNVGAGAGSYEPEDRFLIAVEPSIAMLRQRPRTAAPAVQASADRLPFRDRSFDAALAVLTVHHWPRRTEGLAELRRVARERVVLLTFDPEHAAFWLTQDYFPEIIADDRRRFPSVQELAAELGRVELQALPIPADCVDGFLGAYWRRPEAYLDPQVRAAISSFSRFDFSAGLARLTRDLDNGEWLRRHSELLAQSELDVGYRLVVAALS
jgi:SAM-dependent methyltransferase